MGGEGRDHAETIMTGLSINEPDTLTIAPTNPASINEPITTLAITALNPAQCAWGDPDFDLVVHGTAFNSNCVINFGAVEEATSFDIDTGTLSCTLPSSGWIMSITTPVTVVDGATTSAAVDFIVNDPPP